MRDEAKIWVIIFVGMALFIGLLVASASLGEERSCRARWEDSGRKYDWSFFAGCRVEDKQGRLIPEKNMRDIQ